MDNTINSLVSKAVGVTDQQIRDFLATGPSDAQITAAMQTYGVSPTQLSTVVGMPVGEVVSRVAATIPYGQSAMLGDVVVQPNYEVTGQGQDQQVGPITSINVTKSTGDVNEKAPVGSQYQTYAPDGTLQNTGTVQKYDDKFSLGSVLKDIVSNPGFKIAALAYGGNALMDALGGTGAGSAFEAANAGATAMTDQGAFQLANAGSTALSDLGAFEAANAGASAMTDLGASELANAGASANVMTPPIGTPPTGVPPVVTGVPPVVPPTGVPPVVPPTGVPPVVPPTGVPPVVPPVVTPPVVTPPTTPISTLIPLATGLTASAIGNVASNVANQAGITDARNLINQYGGQAANSLATAYNNAQGLNTANRTDLGNVYQNLNTNLNNTLNAQANLYGTNKQDLYNIFKNSSGNLQDLYNQQVGYQDPYQDIGRAGSQGLLANQDYLTHQFNANDLNTNLAPNYAFQLAQGQMANQRAGNAAGGALGGNALQGLQRYTQDYAGNAYQQAFNNFNNQRQNIYSNLSNMANIGTTSGGQLASLGNTLGGNLGSLSSNFANNMLSNTGQLQGAYNQYGSNLTGAANTYGGNLTTAAGQGINAANAYGLNTANLATGIGGALASNAAQTGANNATMLSNLGNTALLASVIKPT